MSETTEKVISLTVEKDDKPYVFRTLNATDVFLMFKLIKKIGIEEFRACLDSDMIEKAVLIAEKKREEAEEAEQAEQAEAEQTETEIDNLFEIVGVSVALEAANIIITNIPKCETDIYNLLSQTSNLSVEEVKNLDMVTFFEMIVDFVKKDEFKDFMKVVSKLFK